MTDDFEMAEPARREDSAALARAEAAAANSEANPRLPMLCGPKRQHFLPRFYLDDFTRDGLAAVFEREKKRHSSTAACEYGRHWELLHDGGC